jgi:hypothetical protein
VNYRDALVEIQDELKAQNWGVSSNRVFADSSVVVSKAIPREVLRTLRVPIAQIMPGPGRSDPQYGEEPDLLVNQVVVRLFQVEPGDATGEKPLIGANRPNTAKSEGAGLLEIAEEVYNAIGRINVQEGLVIQSRRMGESGPVQIDQAVWWLYQDLEFEVVSTAT